MFKKRKIPHYIKQITDTPSGIRNCFGADDEARPSAAAAGTHADFPTVHRTVGICSADRPVRAAFFLYKTNYGHPFGYP